MKVLDFERYNWFLLQHEDNYFLDVHCSYSFVGFSLLIQLDESEINHYKAKGAIYINELAEDIQYNSKTKYAARNVSGDLGKLGYDAIIAFNKSNNFG